MEENNPQREILVEPQWTMFMDGNGYIALSFGGIPKIEIDGRETVEFILKIEDNRIIKRYNLKKGESKELDNRNLMKLIVAKIDLTLLNPYDDSNRMWLYHKSFLHEPTEISNLFQNLKTVINSKDRRIRLLEAENGRLAEENKLFRSSPAQAAAIGAEIFTKTLKDIGDSGLIRRAGERE